MTTISNIWKRFVKFITFVNLPIKKKFLLFGLGTLFWFFIIGVVSVGVLTFINYRYSQITHTMMPYMKAIHTISPKLESIKEVSKWAESEIDTQKHVVKVTVLLNQIQNAITETTTNRKDITENLNFFEVVTYSLSKDNPYGESTLQVLSEKIKNIDNFLTINSKNISQTTWKTLKVDVTEAQNIIDEFGKNIRTQLEQYNGEINKTIKYSINNIAVIILLASILLVFFTRWLTDAFSKPIESMIQQIHSIGTGEVDLSKKLKIKSEDEIGQLSYEFNKLVDTVYGVTVFKKVIEEDTSLEIVYGRLGEVFEKEAGISDFKIFDVNPAKQEMKIVQPPIFGEDSMVCHEEILHDCTLCRAQKTGHKISSLEYEGVCRQFISDTEKEHVCIPLIISGKPGAVAQFVFDKAKDEADVDKINEQIFKAESYIKNSLSVIETKQLMQTLRESSLVDGLTGLYNRRFLQDHSQQIISGVLRRKKQISLIMCDMDYFKQVNDEHGHDVGDSLLKETSHILKNSIREADVVIRFGGEEFLILLIDSEPDYGVKIAEKIRKKIEQTKFKANGAAVLKKTISMGVSEFPNDTDGFWQAIKFADVALYKAKDSGRNRSIRFTPDLWEESDNF